VNSAKGVLFWASLLSFWAQRRTVTKWSSAKLI